MTSEEYVDLGIEAESKDRSSGRLKGMWQSGQEVTIAVESCCG
jgi:hypothetical protein